MAVRREITLLESRGLVLSQKEKQKIGRPTSFYYLAEKGHEEFHRDYAGLAVDLLVSALDSPQGALLLLPSPHFSHPLYCIGAMIRPDCVALRRPPQRTVQYVSGGLGRAPCQAGPSAAS